MKPSSQAGTPTKRGVLSRRNIVILTAALVLVGGSALFFGSARTSSAVQKPRAQEPGITVDVVQPAPTMFARNLAATGTVRARDELVLGSDASGVRLLEVLVDVGSSRRGSRGSSASITSKDAPSRDGTTTQRHHDI